MKTLLLSSALFCVFFTPSTAWLCGRDCGTAEPKIRLPPVKADIKTECEKLPSAGLEGEICEHADKIILKEGVIPDKIYTSMGI